MKRSKFSLSNYKLLSCNQGSLVPIGLTEVLPGDTIQQATNALIRVSPLLAPVMHPVECRIHHWFVPHRLVWDDWENFITGGPDGMNASAFPVMQEPDSVVGSLHDYLGLPIGALGSLEFSALPFRGYAMIWNEWYRDQDLQTPLTISKASGSDVTTSTALQNVCWEKDYFTSARPWTQKGPEIVIPLASSAPVVPDGTNPTMGNAGAGSNFTIGTTAGSSNMTWRTGTTPPPPGGNYDAAFINSGLETDLSSAAGTINSLREAFAIQRYEEARARYGSRYTEYLRYLGVRSSDARLQRPEYLGGGKQKIQFSEVLQTAPDAEDGTTDDNGVGALKGHGIGAMRSNRYRRFFEEHGYVFTLLSVKPKTMYTQGLSRTWNRRTKEDFFQKELQHIGQQEILNKEIYGLSPSPNGIFGYQDRYSDYRQGISTVAGEFRTTELDFWHMARIFSSAPTLNGDFVKANPTDRIYAAPTNDVLWIMANHSIQARRIVSASTGSHVF